MENMKIQSESTCLDWEKHRGLIGKPRNSIQNSDLQYVVLNRPSLSEKCLSQTGFINPSLVGLQVWSKHESSKHFLKTLRLFRKDFYSGMITIIRLYIHCGKIN